MRRTSAHRNSNWKFQKKLTSTFWSTDFIRKILFLFRRQCCDGMTCDGRPVGQRKRKRRERERFQLKWQISIEDRDKRLWLEKRATRNVTVSRRPMTTTYYKVMTRKDNANDESRPVFSVDWRPVGSQTDTWNVFERVVNEDQVG